MLKEPQISVIMSVFNGEVYLNQAISSVLGQTFRDFELIIINDGSTDDSLKIIKSFNDERIVLLDQANTGLSIALNNGIKISRGKYIARMDADDICNPERFEKQLRFLENNPDTVLVGSNAQIIDMNGDFVYSSNLPTDWNTIRSNFPDSSFFHSSVMYTKSSFNKTNGYFEPTSKIYSFEDSILWNEMKDLGRMENIKEELISYRLIPNAATTKSSKKNKIITSVFYDIIEKGYLTKENTDQLLSIKKSITKEEKLFSYYIHLAKKYTWNNFQRKKIFLNAINAFKIKPFEIDSYIYMFAFLLPFKLIKLINKNR